MMTLERFRITYSTPISRRSTQIIEAHTAKQAVDTIRKMEIPIEIHSVEIQSKRKWEVVSYDQN